MIASCSGNDGSLAELRTAASRECGWLPPPAPSLGRAEDLFVRTLRRDGQDLPGLQDAWRDLHMELIPLREGDAEYLVLREPETEKAGRGFYAFRLGPAPAIALEAPHSAFDKHTGEIAVLLLQEGRLMAGAWSTAPRAKADLAHLPQSWFQSFTAAWARACPGGVILQLHGFEQGKRKSDSAAEADMILSGCGADPPAWLKKMSDGLKRSLSGVVKLYPDDVKDLGGTANAQAQLLRGANFDGFAHIEMSVELRRRLVEEQPLRKTFLECIGSAAGEARPKDGGRADGAAPPPPGGVAGTEEKR